MWTRRKKGWGKKQARQGSDENAFRDDESFFMDRFRCKKLPLHLTEKPISMDSPKKAESLERRQSKKVWNPCNCCGQAFTYKAGNCRRGYWWTSNTVAVKMAMTKERLIRFGFYDLAEAYQSIHATY